MNPQKIARWTGILFLITFITSIPAFFILYADVLNETNYITSAGSDAQVQLGALLEVILIVANIGTAVVLYPIVRRQNEVAAISYVTARVMESAIIAVGIFSVLSVVTLRQDLAGSGADTASLVTAGRSLVALHDWTFLFGPGLFAGLGNGLLLGYLMYRSGLVPRQMAIVGFIGGSLLTVAFVCVLFDVFEAGSSLQALFTLPEAAWELFLGFYLTFKGFKPSPIIAMDPATHARGA
ncbi:MAG: DUF4386 domain-containing protein [Actinobacteria bacterium]|nr:DUF4386 domain-containing protein [Actinomycetota bacterium]